MKHKIKAFLRWRDCAFVYLFFGLLFAFSYGLLPNTDGFSEVLEIINYQFFWPGVFFGVALFSLTEFVVKLFTK